MEADTKLRSKKYKSNLPCPLFAKKGKSPFEKGGFRGISRTTGINIHLNAIWYEYGVV